MNLSQEQVNQFRKKGYLLMKPVFNKQQFTNILKESIKSVKSDNNKIYESTSKSIRTANGTYMSSVLLTKLYQDAKLVKPVMTLLGSSIYLHQFKINIKMAFTGEQWEWHQDFFYWHHEDGMPQPTALTVAIFLDDITEFNAPLIVIPGSHQEGMLSAKSRKKLLKDEWRSTVSTTLKYKLSSSIIKKMTKKYRGLESIKGEKGSILFFHSNLLHCSSNNISPFDRKILFISYNRIDNKLLNKENVRPAFLANRSFDPIEPIYDDSYLILP